MKANTASPEMARRTKAKRANRCPLAFLYLALLVGATAEQVTPSPTSSPTFLQEAVYGFGYRDDKTGDIFHHATLPPSVLEQLANTPVQQDLHNSTSSHSFTTSSDNLNGTTSASVVPLLAAFFSLVTMIFVLLKICSWMNCNDELEPTLPPKAISPAYMQDTTEEHSVSSASMVDVELGSNVSVVEA